MNKVLIESALVDGQWESGVQLTTDERGMIKSIKTNASFDGSTIEHRGFAIPAIANVHSHAFQFRFAGQSEYRTRDNDSFWSWREQMYASLKGFDPDVAFENAKRLYSLMLKRGFSSVGEFHYVHSNDAGAPGGPLDYVDAHINAAAEVGIRITMLPVLYQRGGFQDEPLADAQARFELSDNGFLELLSQIKDKHSSQLVNLGMAFHSLRAVNPAKVGRIAEQFSSMSDGPIHIHVAEQKKEVADCLAVTGKRPVELLFEHGDVNERWCLIHATHLTESEIELIAKSKAVVGLCPTTEANLGDGVFSSEKFMNAGGRISIGSDSHIALCPFSELRTLEYGQRLTTNRRAVLCSTEESCGNLLYRQAFAGGLQAMGQQGQGGGFGLSVDGQADFVVINDLHAGVQDVPEQHRLDRLMFGEYGSAIEAVYVAGKKVFSAG